MTHGGDGRVQTTLLTSGGTIGNGHNYTVSGGLSVRRWTRVRERPRRNRRPRRYGRYGLHRRRYHSFQKNHA